MRTVTTGMKTEKMNGKKTHAAGAVFFASFMFVQFVLLRIGNRAGRGYLSDARQEHVYYLLQVFVILGFLAFSGAEKALRGRKAERWVNGGALALLLLGAAGMFAVPAASAPALIITYITVSLLGYVGGAVYLRMAEQACSGAPVSLYMGAGCASAAALQYVLQLRWDLTVPLALCVAAAFSPLTAGLMRPERAPETAPVSDKEPVNRRTLLRTVLIAALMMTFTSFYNGYIHHLQVASGYTDYNVYTWPRLMWIPAYLLFGLLGRYGRRRLVPVAALCVGIVALLNSVLILTEGGELLNMCLFYIAVAAYVSYYDLTFWGLACRTKRPALWASAGRILDSFLVLVHGALRVSLLPAAAVLTADIAALAALIMLMALNGDLSFAAAQARPAAPADPPPPRQSDPFETMRERYGLTERETRVLRELVLTEDKQAAIGDRLSIKLRTVQANVTAIYRKTGVSTRAGLVQLYNETE